MGAIPGFRWIRLLYGYPTRITQELLEVMAAEPRICPYLDIPIQHGHDEVLRRMGRGYTRAQIIDLVRLIREVLPRGDPAHHGAWWVFPGRPKPTSRP